MKNSAKTAYAFKDGRLVHVSSVARGKWCDCYCPKCNASVIARKGDVREHHFAHIPGAECAGAAETAIHLLSKEILTELDSISIPPYNYIRTKSFPNKTVIIHNEKIANGGEISIDAVELEKYHGSIRPDAVITSYDKILIIEIAVTHKVDKNKQRIIRKLDVPAIEILIPDEYAMKDRDEIKYFIQSSIDNKRWLYHPREKHANIAFYSKCRAVKGRYSRNDDIFNIQSINISNRMRDTSSKDSKWYEINRRAEEFNRKHGYYPSAEEAVLLWPELMK